MRLSSRKNKNHLMSVGAWIIRTVPKGSCTLSLGNEKTRPRHRVRFDMDIYVALLLCGSGDVLSSRTG